MDPPNVQGFTMLWRFKAALEESCPGSIVEIDCKKIKGKMHFSRMFVSIRACVDGFLSGCKPYLGVDSTHLTGKYKGQLAAATAIDGHNWMYPVAYAIADILEGHILPSVLHELNMKSRGLHYDFTKSGPLSAEISGTTNEGKTWRYGVDLAKRECGSGQWEVSGKPCTHAIFLIGKVRQLKIEDFVDDYYSIQRFKLAYQFEVTPIGDKSQWPKNDPPFEVVPPPLERPAGRPRKQRIKASGDPGKRGPYQCKRCFQFGHIENGCFATQAELEQELPPLRPKKPKQQRKTKTQSVESSNIVAEPSNFVVDPKVMSSPGVTTRRMASLSPTSPGVTTRRMASLSPTSPGVTTKRMTSLSPTSPGNKEDGINLTRRNQP